MTASFVINRVKIKEKLPDLDEKLAAFRTIADKFVDQILTQTYQWIDREEASIPTKYWITVDPENEQKYWVMLKNARIEMTKQGYYDPKMIALLKVKPGMTREQFIDRWVNKHAPFTCKFPNLKGYLCKNSGRN